jgi:hypothetical protein
VKCDEKGKSLVEYFGIDSRRGTAGTLGESFTAVGVAHNLHRRLGFVALVEAGIRKWGVDLAIRYSGYRSKRHSLFRVYSCINETDNLYVARCS